MSHSDDVSIRRFREPDLCQLVRLISETIGISYAEVYPPRAVQFFKDFHSDKKIADRSKTGTTLVVEEDGELVATGSLVDGEILAVFVHPRLQRGGRGKTLMKALENEAPRKRRDGNWAEHPTALKEILQEPRLQGRRGKIERRRRRSAGEWVWSFAIITTIQNEPWAGCTTGSRWS
jgi:GNAT superfamily N-acetyltransferase